MKKILVCGAGGFIGHHLVKHLKNQGHKVFGVDLKFPRYEETAADTFIISDLRHPELAKSLVKMGFDQIYQFAADMGGAGYVFTGDNDADIMHNSCLINLNMLHAMKEEQSKSRILYTSSACGYPSHNQTDPDNPLLEESSMYPANPDSNYGWEKIYSERLYESYHRNYDIDVRIVRLHNVFGPLGTWNNGREKAPAAICRKVSMSEGTVEIWGPGNQTRSFLYIDECLEGLTRMMNGDFIGPVNLGSTRMISINDLTKLVANIAGKEITINNVPGPVGVMGRNSDNRLIQEKLGWSPADNLEQGLKETYDWIDNLVKNNIQDYDS